MENSSTEEMSLGIELEHILLQAGLSHLLVDLDSIVVLLKESIEVGNLQQALVGGSSAILTEEVISSLLIVLDTLLRLVVALVHLSNLLLQLGSVGKTAHVAEQRNSLLIVLNSLIQIRLLMRGDSCKSPFSCR